MIRGDVLHELFGRADAVGLKPLGDLFRAESFGDADADEIGLSMSEMPKRQPSAHMRSKMIDTRLEGAVEPAELGPDPKEARRFQDAGLLEPARDLGRRLMRR